ncbi:hypothetical protein NC652_041235 [Populus alba x Populus x berolinensis]|nr:hypothetical protein NC652_041235 [Populus alba x Populus x berolinensis]
MAMLRSNFNLPSSKEQLSELKKPKFTHNCHSYSICQHQSSIFKTSVSSLQQFGKTNIASYNYKCCHYNFSVLIASLVYK